MLTHVRFMQIEGDMQEFDSVESVEKFINPRTSRSSFSSLPPHQWVLQS